MKKTCFVHLFWKILLLGWDNVSKSPTSLAHSPVEFDSTTNFQVLLLFFRRSVVLLTQTVRRMICDNLLVTCPHTCCVCSRIDTWRKPFSLWLALETWNAEGHNVDFVLNSRTHLAIWRFSRLTVLSAVSSGKAVGPSAEAVCFLNLCPSFHRNGFAEQHHLISAFSSPRPAVESLSCVSASFVQIGHRDCELQAAKLPLWNHSSMLSLQGKDASVLIWGIQTFFSSPDRSSSRSIRIEKESRSKLSFYICFWELVLLTLNPSWWRCAWVQC